MKKIFLVLFLLITSLTYSQSYKVIYEVNFKTDSLSNINKNEQMSLYFNESESFYVSDKFVAFDNLMNNEDKLNSLLNSGTLNVAEIREKFPESLITHSIINTVDKFEIYSKLDRKIYKITQPKQNLNWVLVNENKYEDGMLLKKAVVIAYGRKWEAWYRDDIAVQFGPYKFEGLPGLITELSDNDKYFNFKMISFEKVNNFPNVVAINKAEDINFKDFMELFNYRENLKIDRFKNLNIISSNISLQEIEKKIDKKVKAENLHLEKDLNITF